MCSSDLMHNFAKKKTRKFLRLKSVENRYCVLLLSLLFKKCRLLLSAPSLLFFKILVTLSSLLKVPSASFGKYFSVTVDLKSSNSISMQCTQCIVKFLSQILRLSTFKVITFIRIMLLKMSQLFPKKKIT